MTTEQEGMAMVQVDYADKSRPLFGEQAKLREQREKLEAKPKGYVATGLQKMHRKGLIGPCVKDDTPLPSPGKTEPVLCNGQKYRQSSGKVAQSMRLDPADRWQGDDSWGRIGEQIGEGNGYIPKATGQSGTRSFWSKAKNATPVVVVKKKRA